MSSVTRKEMCWIFCTPCDEMQEARVRALQEPFRKGGRLGTLPRIKEDRCGAGNIDETLGLAQNPRSGDIW